jgi:hypothetical protein
MAFNKKNNGNKVRAQLDDTLSDLLGDDNLLDDMTDNGGGLPRVHAPEQHDYVKLKGDASERAKKTITSLMKFYLTEDIIDKDEYIQAKKKIDEMTLSSLIFQLEAGERALVTLMRTIDSGELSPRMFEVLATLQKSMLDIIKSQTMYLMAAEEGAKKLSRDVEVYKGLKRNSVAINAESSNVNMGTKALMQSIQDEIQAEAPIVDNTPKEAIKLDEMSDVTSIETIGEDTNIIYQENLEDAEEAEEIIETGSVPNYIMNPDDDEEEDEELRNSNTEDDDA